MQFRLLRRRKQILECEHAVPVAPAAAAAAAALRSSAAKFVGFSASAFLGSTALVKGQSGARLVDS